MPRSGKEISIVGGPRGGGDRDQFEVSVDRTLIGETEDVDDRRNRKERTGLGRATEQAVMVPFTKVKKQFNLRRKKEKINRIPSSSSFLAIANADANDDNGNTSSSLSSGKRVGMDSDASCFCFKKPQTLDSSSSPTPESSNTSDPNDPKFTSDMLKTLMQTNDFYSEDCNPHTC